MLIYFYELSLRLLNTAGYNVFITENSWLSTDYGKAFQDFLRTKCDVHAIIDSDYKYFETADINTVITFFRNKQYLSNKSPVRFFHCFGSLTDYPCNTFSNSSSANISLKRFSSDDSILVSNKWSVAAGTEAKMLRIMTMLFAKQSDSLSRRISIGQGLNITKNNIVYDNFGDLVPYYTSDMGATYSWEHACSFVRPDIASDSRKKPLLILPRGLGTHFCSINNCGGFTSSYVEIYGDLSHLEKLSIWIFCNSSLLWLLRELTGRTNLGGGMLKAEATDLRGVPLAFIFDAESVSECYTNLKGKSLDTNLMVTLNSIEHQIIDDVVFSHLGLTNEKEYIIRMLIDKVNGRMKKSISR